MKEDVEHLKILSIFHYVLAAIVALISCFPIFHLLIGLSMFLSSLSPSEMPEDAPFLFTLFSLMFILIPAFIILSGWVLAGCLAISGYFLSKKVNFLFCLVMAGISCMFAPIGTVLGVFTIIVLMRPSVKKLFNYEVSNNNA